MKKVLSLVLVAAMLVCGMAIIPSATAATLDEHNVSAEAYYFGGEVKVKEAEGTLGSEKFTWHPEKVVREGDPSKGSITLDGNIEDGEWGSPVARIRSEYAANNDGKEYGRNTSFDEPSAENTYYYYKTDPKTKKSLTPKGLNFDIYLMWDEEFLYVAAHVIDNDGYNAVNQGPDAWNNDAFQFRVDPQGPNSIVDGSGYDAKGGLFDYVSPWKGVEYNDKHGVLKETVGNFIVSYVKSTELYDASCRYNPEEIDYVFKDGTNGTVTQYSGEYANYADMMEIYGIGGIYGTAMTEDISPNQFQRRNRTDYEVAVSWDIVKEGYLAQAGNELGFAAVLLNASQAKGGAYNAWLGWGNGICASQMTHDPQTCGGSNSITLSSTPYTTARCEHNFAAATCVAPETCTLCGYQRGYKTGHTFDYSDLVLPTTESAGSVVATCSVDGHVENITIPKADNKNVQYSFTTSDVKIQDKGFSDGFTAAWRENNEVDEKFNRIGPILYNTDGSIMNSCDRVSFPDLGSVVDLYTNGSARTTQTVADDVKNGNQAGTYFSMDSWNSTYTYKMDVYFPDLSTDASKDDYISGIRNVFGNLNVYGTYSAGIFRFPTNEGYEYYAGIIYTKTGQSLETTADQFKAKALSYTKLDAADMAEKVWHTYAFMFDDASGTAVFAWDGKIMAYASDKHMCYKDTQDEVAYLRRYNVGAYIKDIVFGSPALMSDYVSSAATKYTVTIDGVATEYEVGATVSLNKPFYREGICSYRFVTWSGDTDVLADATAGVTEFTMPAKDVTLTSNYIIIGDANEDGEVNAIDLNLFRRMLVGLYGKKDCMNINNDEDLNAIDLNLFRRMLVGLYTPTN